MLKNSLTLKAFLLFTISFLLPSLGISQNQFRFTINNKIYNVDEPTLDNCFGLVFNELMEAKISKEKHFSIWSSTYRVWKNNAAVNNYSWKLYGSRVAEVKIVGNIHPLLTGLNSDGKPITKGNPNDEKNIGRRMAYLNGMMTRALTNLLIPIH